tara:strand:- start:2981 stop:3133 length:153 start_codon:yes stop_codon:yes gene_type:complete
MKNKYFYFLLGYLTAILTAVVISCGVSPLEAEYFTPGHSETFPLYVKVVD